MGPEKKKNLLIWVVEDVSGHRPQEYPSIDDVPEHEVALQSFGVGAMEIPLHDEAPSEGFLGPYSDPFVAVQISDGQLAFP